ncbi:hypothetical protein RI367_000226 [Sorochytrium milnesiophthora]
MASRSLRDVLLSAASWAPLIVFGIDHGASLTSATGRSMQPTFNPDSNLLRKDVLLLNHYAAQRQQIQRGDVVTLKSPTEPRKTLTKRIVALEDDYIAPHATSPFARRARLAPGASICVPKGHVWVEGDEPQHSRDSNQFGPVPLALVTGKVSAIVWPLSRVGWVHNELRPSVMRRLVKREMLY